AIAPEVTMTTSSPPACSSATCEQTRSSTSLRIAPSSPATIDEPSFATTVMARQRVRAIRLRQQTAARRPLRVQLELQIADDHLVAGLEPDPPELGDHADLAKPPLQVVDRLLVLEVVPRHQQFDPTTEDAEPALPVRDHLEALLGTGTVDAMLGLEPAGRGVRPALFLGQPGEDRGPETIEPRAGGGG